MLIYFLLVLGDTYRDRLPWFRPWQPVVGVIAALFIASFVSKRHRLRKKGFKPGMRGFSGEVDLLRKKMEERLAEVKDAVRYQREVDPLPEEFMDFAREVIRTATIIDKKHILDQLSSLRERDAWMQLHTTFQNEEFQEQLRRYDNAMTMAIRDLTEYSEDLKRRGGLYKLSKKEFGISMILIVSSVGTGAILLWLFRQERSWQFWIGGVSVVIGAIITALLLDVLRGQESEPPLRS